MAYEEQKPDFDEALKELGWVVADALYLEQIDMWLYRIFTIKIW